MDTQKHTIFSISPAGLSARFGRTDAQDEAPGGKPDTLTGARP